MSKTSNRILRFSVFLLLIGLGLCIAAEQKDAATPDNAGGEFFSEEKIEIILEGIAKEDFAKAEALEILHHKDFDQLTKDEIGKSLRWIEDKEKVTTLKGLWEKDRAAFDVAIQNLVETEVRIAARDQKRGAIRDGIFGTIGGLGLFLFGMGLMSDGLKKVAGQKLKSLLEVLTKHRVVAVITGALVTALIQSSSATTVMTVGLVNAGLLTLKQSLCVVLGANIGTTITAGLVSVLALFKITNYALPAVGLGFLLTIAGK